MQLRENVFIFRSAACELGAEGRVSVEMEWAGSLWIFYRYFLIASECGLLLFQFFLCSLQSGFNSAIARSINVCWGGGGGFEELVFLPTQKWYNF